MGYGCPHCKTRNSVIEYYQPAWDRLQRYCFTCSWKESAPLPRDVQIWRNEREISVLESKKRILLTRAANAPKIETGEKPSQREQPMSATQDENDYLMTPEDFLKYWGYGSGGEYLNYCLDNQDAERDYGTSALCYGECVISPGQDRCSHGCKSAAEYFEFCAKEEGR